MTTCMLQPFKNARSIAKDEEQIPISLTSMDTAACEASQALFMADGETILVANCGKDITLRDAFTSASWYGQLAGGSPLSYRWAAEVVQSIIETDQLEDIQATPLSDLPRRLLSGLDIATIHGPFVDFWGVCLKHRLV